MKAVVIGYVKGEHCILGEIRLRKDGLAFAVSPECGDPVVARDVLSKMIQESAGADPAAWLKHTPIMYTGAYLRAAFVPDAPGLVSKEFDESKHPREPAGGEGGGQFTSGGGGGAAAETGEGSDTISSHPDWENKSPEDKARQIKLEAEAKTGREAVAKLVPDVVGEHREDPTDEDEDAAAVTPESWDELANDQQEQAKDKWKEDTKQEFLESEIESYNDESSNFEHIPEQVSEDSEWAHEHLKYINTEYYPGEAVPGTGEGEGEGPEGPAAEAARRRAEWTKNFDLDKSISNDAFSWNDDGKLEVDTDKLAFRNNPYSDEAQQMIPGVDRAEMESRWKESQWAGANDDFVTDFKEGFEKEVESRTDKEKENPPDYLSDQVDDDQEQSWDSMSDDEKFKHAQEHLDLEIESGDQPGGGPVREPSHYSLFESDQELGGDEAYGNTGRLGRALATARTEQIIKERDIASNNPYGSVEHMVSEVWKGWKGSSTNSMGKMLQVAAADELGGHLQDKLSMPGEVTSKADTIRQGKAYPFVRAYVRGLWETTQYLMSKANVSEVSAYRGIMLEGDDKFFAEPMKDVHVSDVNQTFKHMTDLKLQRNGASSWTADSGTANSWGGVGVTPENPQRVVLRAEVPATAVLALPVYGQNVHSEQEIVLVGTPWKKWDAWHKKAPQLEHYTIEKRSSNA